MGKAGIVSDTKVKVTFTDKEQEKIISLISKAIIAMDDIKRMFEAKVIEIRAGGFDDDDE